MKRIAILAVILGVFAAILLLPGAMKPRGKEYCSDCSWPVNTPHDRAEYGPWTRGSSPFNLKHLASAQADFRANDRDGNGIQDYWRKDVAGLYALPGKDNRPIAVIELIYALADDHPSFDLSSVGRRAPYRGSLFRAIPHEGEGKPDPNRFAYCQFPAEYPHHGKWTFIIDESNMVFRKDVGHGRGIEVYPANPEQLGWMKLD